MKNVTLFLLLLPLAAVAHGQQTGSIVGSVKDTSGALIPGAKVTITSTSTQTQRVVLTNGVGEYVATSLPIGSYTISVLKDGFQRLDHKASLSPQRPPSRSSCRSPSWE